MIPLSLFPWKWIAIVGVVVAIFAGEAYLMHRARMNGEAAASARYEAALTKQKVAAARALADAMIDVANAEKKLNDFKNTQEVKDAAANKTNLDQAARLRELAGPIGRLRDPFAAPGCGGCRDDTEGEVAASANRGSGDAAAAGGLLSADLTRLLLWLAADADAVSAAFSSCKSYVQVLQSTMGQE